MFTPEQQLDNLIRWRDELASGRHKKCVDHLDGPGGTHCAWGVLYIIDPRADSTSFVNPADDKSFAWLMEVVNVNDENPGDNFVAVIEYLNEEITRRKVALGVPVNDTESHQAAAVECEAVRA